MNNLSTSPNVPQRESQISLHLAQQRQSSTSPRGFAYLIQLWYWISSPPEPGASASFEERELFRRGRTGSRITIFLYILVFLSFPAAAAGSNSLLVAILIIDLFVLTFAIVLNRFRRVSAAGIMVVLCMAASPTVNILTTPGGVNTSALPIFGLLVVPLMCAVSFLPAWWVFVVGAANCLFALYALKVLPSSGELHQVLNTAFPGIFIPIVIGQVLVSIVAFLWVSGATQALRRADRAEVIVKLEADEIKRQEAQIEISKQVEDGIQQILTTLNSVVAQNDFAMRVPLKQENILWRVGRSINNLLARLQGLKRDHEELKRTHAVATVIAEYMKEGQPIKLETWTGTAFDPIIMAYNKQIQKVSVPLAKSRSTTTNYSKTMK